MPSLACACLELCELLVGGADRRAVESDLRSELLPAPTTPWRPRRRESCCACSSLRFVSARVLATASRWCSSSLRCGRCSSVGVSRSISARASCFGPDAGALIHRNALDRRLLERLRKPRRRIGKALAENPDGERGRGQYREDDVVLPFRLRLGLPGGGGIAVLDSDPRGPQEPPSRRSQPLWSRRWSSRNCRLAGLFPGGTIREDSLVTATDSRACSQRSLESWTRAGPAL
jgi:hypothetical protein